MNYIEKDLNNNEIQVIQCKLKISFDWYINVMREKLL